MICVLLFSTSGGAVSDVEACCSNSHYGMCVKLCLLLYYFARLCFYLLFISLPEQNHWRILDKVQFFIAFKSHSHWFCVNHCYIIFSPYLDLCIVCSVPVHCCCNSEFCNSLSIYLCVCQSVHIFPKFGYSNITVVAFFYMLCKVRKSTFKCK